MTLIVMNPALLQSKAVLKAALDEGGVLLHEPSVMGQWTKFARDLPVGFADVVTRMPKRDKFVQILRTEAGWKVS